MFLSSADIRVLVEQISKILINSRAQKVQSAYPSGFQLTFVSEETTRYLLLFDDKRFPAIAGSKKPWPMLIQDNRAFMRMLKNSVSGRRLLSLKQVSNDRIVLLDFGPVKIVIECVERFANIYLLDKDDRVINSHNPPRVPLLLHEKYSVPAANAPSETTAKYKTVDEVCVAILDLVGKDEKRSAINSTNREIKKKRGLLKKLQVELKESEGADELKREGELLKRVAHTLPPGAKSARVTDYTKDPPEIVTLKIEAGTDPKKYVDQLFQRYKKLKRAAENIKVRIQTVSKEIEALESKRERLETGELTLPIVPELPVRRKKRLSGPRKFGSTDGYDIFVAKNAQQGAELLRQSRGNDLWLHVLNATGPHLLVKRKKKEDIPRSTIIEAASLALHFSSLKKQKRGDVVFAECRYVRFVKGGKGKVTYSRSKTVAVKIDDDLLSLFENKRGEA